MTGREGLTAIHRLRRFTVVLKNLLIFRKASPFVTSPVVRASFILIAQKGCSCSPWFCTGPSSKELKDIRRKGAMAQGDTLPTWKKRNKNQRPGPRHIIVTRFPAGTRASTEATITWLLFLYCFQWQFTNPRRHPELVIQPGSLQTCTWCQQREEGQVEKAPELLCHQLY